MVSNWQSGEFVRHVCSICVHVVISGLIKHKPSTIHIHTHIEVSSYDTQVSLSRLTVVHVCMSGVSTNHSSHTHTHTHGHTHWGILRWQPGEFDMSVVHVCISGLSTNHSLFTYTIEVSSYDTQVSLFHITVVHVCMSDVNTNHSSYTHTQRHTHWGIHLWQPGEFVSHVCSTCTHVGSRELPKHTPFTHTHTHTHTHREREMYTLRNPAVTARWV